MANKTATFFEEKIDKIMKIIGPQPSVTRSEEESKIPNFNNLALVSQEDVRKIIMEGNNKSCVLDPIPTTSLKSSLDCLLPVIT